MYDLMIYCLKAGACLAVFYLFFKLLLSRETFHRFNRVVVLCALVGSFVLPLCVITVYREIPRLPVVEVAQTAAITAETPVKTFDWQLLVGTLFLLGATVSLVRTLCSLGGVIRLIRRGRHEPIGNGVVLVHTDNQVNPFSWGRYLVLSEQDLSENGAAIIIHEREHIRLHHSADLLLTDLLACLQWFNPAMWLLRRELRAIHEYEADEAVLNSGVDARTYQLLLIKKAAGGRWYAVANSFNHSKLKNRITMMLRKPSSRWAGAKVLLLLPLAALALGAFAQTTYVSSEDHAYKAGDTIRIAGLDYANQPAPLYLVNGQQVADVNSINPAQIQSISISKDSTVVAKYGEKARNGVVMVTLYKPGTNRTTVLVNPDSTGTKVVTVTSDSGSNTTFTSPSGNASISSAIRDANSSTTVTSVTTSSSDSGLTVSYSSDGKTTSSTMSIKSDQSDAADAKSLRVHKATISSDQITVSDNLSDKMLVFINGKKASAKQVAKLKKNQIREMTIYEGADAVESYGEAGRDGVVVIKTRRR